MLSQSEVTNLLEQIKGEITAGKYELPAHLLRLAENDQNVMPFVKGRGGYNYQFFALFNRYFKPKNILELGNLQGVSTVMMYSELASDATLTTVDIIKDQRYVPEEVFKDPRVKFVYGDGLNLNIYNNTIPKEIDLWFTDTVHFYQQVRDEFDVYEPLLADGAFILIDDINLKDKRKLFDELSFEKWDLTEWCHHNGFGLLRYRKINNFPNPEAEAALRSSRIAFRKFNSLKNELDSQFYRKKYSKARDWAKNHTKLAASVRRVLKPLKKIYTPKEKEY